MSTQNKNRPGYKKTKVGWIPEEWECVSLGERIKLLSGQHINAEDYNEEDLGMPYLTGPTDYQTGNIKPSKFTVNPKVTCNKGDILITCKGSGTGALAVADTVYCISRQIMAIQPEQLHECFAFSLLENAQHHFEGQAVGLIPGISRSDILNYPIPLPPYPTMDGACGRKDYRK